MHPRPVRHLLGLLLALVLSLVLSLGFAAVRPAAAVRAPAPASEAVWPLAPVPEVVEGFDPPDVRWGAGHRGVDLAGSAGQQVRAALGGTVTFAGTLAGRGVVVVDHGATRTTYEPVAASVAVGDQIAAGDPIGHLQRGGTHCFPAACLHWGLRAGDLYLDPLSLVGAGPVRLLPVGAAAPFVGVTRGPAPATFPTWAWAPPADAALGRPRGDAALFRDG